MVMLPLPSSFALISSALSPAEEIGLASAVPTGSLSLSKLNIALVKLPKSAPLPTIAIFESSAWSVAVIVCTGDGAKPAAKPLTTT